MLQSFNNRCDIFKFSMDMLYLFVYIRYLYNVQVIFCILTGWLTWVSWRKIHSNTIPLLHLIAFWYYARLILIHKSTTRTNGRNLKLNFCFEETVEIFRPNDLETMIINAYYFWFLKFICNTIYLIGSRF